MARSGATWGREKRRRGLPKYFYLDVENKGPLLHRTIAINSGQDTISTWCYSLGRRVVYSYTHVKSSYEPGFNTQEVAFMLNRSPGRLKLLISSGMITRPESMGSIGGDNKPRGYMWHEKNIMEAHECLSNVHRGRPRKDGEVTSWRLPTPRELRAMIRQEEIVYIRDKDTGEFVPVWRAPNF